MGNYTPEDLFRSVMADNGIVYGGPIIADGNIHRFRPDGCTHGEPGWYILHLDGVPSGAYGDWRKDNGFTWCSKNKKELTLEERNQQRIRVAQASRIREEERKRNEQHCLREAKRLWTAARSIQGQGHPYLARKVIDAEGIRLHGDTLLIPAYNIDGELRSLQKIEPDGVKKFLYGTAKHGLKFTFNGNSKKIYICEGYATGATIHAATGAMTVCAFDAGNLKPVGMAIKSKYPNAEIIYAADNDQYTKGRGNKGIEEARKAIAETGGKLVFPKFKVLDGQPTDFNDLYQREELDGVRQQLENYDTTLCICVQGAEAILAPSITTPSLLDTWSPKQWPKLSEKALYGLAGKVVALACRNSEADPAAVLATFLVAFAAEAGSIPYMWVGDTKHFARLFAAIVGGSSKARKGTSSKPIVRLFRFFRQSTDEYIPARMSGGPLSSGEGLVYNVRDPQHEYIIVDKASQKRDWVVTDPGVEDKRLFVADEEFAAALSCMRREGNTLSTIMRQTWDDGEIEPLTKTNRIKATGAHINVVTHITNTELQQKLHETEALNGFGNRFLWIYAKRNGLVSRPRPMPETEVDQLHRRIIAAAKLAQEHDRPMEFDNSTWAMWDAVYPELSQDHPGLAGVIINRAEAQVIRLSMVYALLDGDTIIKPKHLEAALAFWDYCKQSALFIFDGRETDSVADKILEALAGGELTATKINDVFAHNIPAARIKTVLQDLSDRGRIASRRVQPDGKGRPITVYKLAEVDHEVF